MFVAGGDVNGDGIAEIITGTARAGGPVRVFTIGGPGRVAELTSFFAYFPAFQGFVRVAAADVNGDGRADIITGAGPGGGPHVRVFNLAGGIVTEVASFFAYDLAICDIANTTPDPTFCDGVYVAAGDVTGDGLAEVITGTNRQEGPLRVFQIGPVVTELTSFYPYFEAFRGPARVAAVDLNRIVPEVRPGFLSRLTPAILEPRDEAGVQQETVVAYVVRKALHAGGRAEDLILPREEVDVGTVARAGWLQPADQARRARAPPYAATGPAGFVSCGDPTAAAGETRPCSGAATLELVLAPSLGRGAGPQPLGAVVASFRPACWRRDRSSIQASAGR